MRSFHPFLLILIVDARIPREGQWSHSACKLKLPLNPVTSQRHHIAQRSHRQDRDPRQCQEDIEGEVADPRPQSAQPVAKRQPCAQRKKRGTQGTE
ncbi:hypothetical protein HZA86_05420 [Candidatus Uhrbacteria bacterium]|nr:hypothetical protein [Candidatus Uhrbacteria bacterium]